MEKSAAYYFGQALAIIEKAMPGGLSATAINNAMALPGSYFGQLIRDAQKHMTPELDREMADVVDHVSDWPHSLTLVQQGDCQLGMAHMRQQLEGRS